MLRSKKIFLIFLFSVLLISVASFVIARELEISYPAFGNIAAPQSTKTALPDYVRYIFNFVLIISGFIVAGVIVFAGVQLLTQAQNPAALGEAKSRMMDAIIGLVILFGSYIFLTTINPQLVIINPTLLSKSGVILYSSFADCDRLKDSPEKDTKLRPETDWNRYGVSASSLGNLNGRVGAIYPYKAKDDLEIKLYPQEKWEPKDGGVLVENTQSGQCIQPPLSSAKSLELNWQNPGVYLCADQTAKKCSIYNASQSKLADGFNDNVNYIKFKNPYSYKEVSSLDECNSLGGTYFTTDNQGKHLEKPVCGYYSQKYGAVLHEDENYKATCKEFLRASSFSQKGSTNIFPGPSGVSAITVFLQADKITEGSEVVLCQNQECLDAECFIDSNPCNGIDDRTGEKITEGASVILRYGTGVPERPQGIYYSASGEFPDFDGKSPLKWQNPNIEDKVNDNVMAIKVKGNLKPVLFWDAGFQNKCEVLTTDSDPNLTVGNYVGSKVSALKIIPIKK